MRLKTIRDDDSMTYVSLQGRLDVQGVNEVQYEFLHLTTSRPRSTLVDLSQVSFIGSLGIGMLISATKYLERHGARLVLLSPSAMVRKAILTADPNQGIPIADKEPAALELLR